VSKLFDFSNEGFTNMRYKKGQAIKSEAEGWCFGYSLNWCTRMLKNSSKPKLAKPTSMDAGPLQQKVEMIDLDWDGAVAKVVTELGYNCGAPLSRDWNVLPGVVSEAGNGFYIIDIGHHWVGFGVANGKFYYFDANDGLFEFADKGKFSSFVVKDFKASYKGDKGFEKGHKAYKITS